MSQKSYKVKPRPNLFDLAIMDGFLCGGGNLPTIQREAYWAKPVATNSFEEDIKSIKPKS